LAEYSIEKCGIGSLRLCGRLNVLNVLNKLRSVSSRLRDPFAIGGKNGI